jgi:hypothetical protein
MIHIVRMLMISVALCMGSNLLGAEVPASTNASDSKASGARIRFEKPEFDFGKVVAGESVKHTFYFTNTGEGVLIISNVQPSCGCTTAGEWTRQVEPGKFGSIPVQFNSVNFNGAVHKTVSVASNDRSQPIVALQVNGTVWKPIEILPQYVVLNVPPDSQTASNVVRVINNTDVPMVVSDLQSLSKFFTATLKTNAAGKEYHIVVSTVPPLPSGNNQGQITLKTSSTNFPLVTITAIAYVQPAVSVLPPQIGIPPGPLDQKLSPTITIINNSTNALALSEPSMNRTNVSVQLKETQVGKTFVVTLNFPEGFENTSGQPMAFTVKSDHPQYPEIKVPVHQLQRPIAAATAQALPGNTALPGAPAQPPPLPSGTGPK